MAGACVGGESSEMSFNDTLIVRSQTSRCQKGSSGLRSHVRIAGMSVWPLCSANTHPNPIAWLKNLVQRKGRTVFMKGIVLAGGLGSRLHPLTRVTNKHLLPVYDRPMIFYPIQTLVDAGIEEILIVTGGQNAGDFLRLLSNGKDFGLKHLNYAYQEGEGGIADALRLAEHFTDGESLCVVLGD